MQNLTQKQIAAENTLSCPNHGNNHYWCYICQRCLNYQRANIDHIKAISCFSQAEKSKPTFQKYGASFNIGLGVVKNQWYDIFADDNNEAWWFHNNLVLTHKTCNNEYKDQRDFTSYYIRLLKNTK